MRKGIIASILLITGLLTAGDSMFSSGDFSYSVPRYSVTVSLYAPGDADYLEKQGFLVEWAHGGRARIYVDAEMEDMLRRMGFDPVRLYEPEPLVPYPSITEIYDSIDDVVAAHPQAGIGFPLAETSERCSVGTVGSVTA